MSNSHRNKFRESIFALAVCLAVCVSASAQTQRTSTTTFQLGDQLIVIPAPEGFEDAASQFAELKAQFTATEDPGNDMLAIYLPQSDCERFRLGEVGPAKFYTKVSIRKAARERDMSAADFASIPNEFRKSGAAELDVNGARMKAAVERLENSLNEQTPGKATIALSQPVNLGEFDNRANVYGVALLVTMKVSVAGQERVVPLVGGISFVRVKQRLLYVYTYRRYESKNDIEILRDFAKEWVTNILAAN